VYVIAYVFVEEARDKISIVFSRELEPLGPRTEMLAYPPDFREKLA